MNILVTGCSGFIGYHLSSLLLKKKFNVYGIDNLNKYYDIKLKQAFSRYFLLMPLKFQQDQFHNDYRNFYPLLK